MTENKDFLYLVVYPIVLFIFLVFISLRYYKSLKEKNKISYYEIKKDKFKKENKKIYNLYIWINANILTYPIIAFIVLISKESDIEINKKYIFLWIIALSMILLNITLNSYIKKSLNESTESINIRFMITILLMVLSMMIGLWWLVYGLVMFS